MDIQSSDAKQLNIKKNYIFNLIYQIFTLIVPLIVTPYISRVIGVDGSGQYGYTSSIITYFTLFATLGFNYYGQRMIASHQDNKKAKSIDFYEIVIARFFTSAISLTFFFILYFLNVYGEKYNKLMLLQVFLILSVMNDISFFFQGNEEFAKPIFRNVVVKLLSIVAIFIFVKDYNDIGLYILIQTGTSFFANFTLWGFLKNSIQKVKLKDLHPFKHLIPAIILFLPTISTNIYSNIDKLLIGLITGIDSETGNYEYADKIIKIGITIVTALGTVIIPRNAYYFAIGDMDKVKENLLMASKFTLFIGIPLMFGLIAISNNLVPWYLGKGYEKVATLIKLLSPLILIMGFSNVFGVQFLLPKGRDKIFTISVCLGAFINLLLSIILIYYYKSYGAAIASIIAEFSIALLMRIAMGKFVNFRSIFKSSIKYSLAGIIMFIICYFVSNNMASSFINTLSLIIIGAVSYFACLILLKEDIIMTAIKSIFKSHKNVK